MSTGTKRMSADDKRKTILSIYHSTKSVYTEKEIVALAAKAGVASNTIVDVNQSLVDDGLVDKEKIGGSNFFWSFPAKADRKLQLEHRATLERIETLRSELAQAKHRLDDARRGREDDEADVEVNAAEMEEVPPDTTVDDEAGTAAGEKRAASTITAAPSSLSRATKLQRLEELRVQRVQVERELAVLRENDPQALADLEKELQLVTEAAHRWTDNIFNCKSYLVKKRGMDRKEAEKLLGITSAFDYPEDKNFKK